jgi:hypothetical protein
LLPPPALFLAPAGEARADVATYPTPDESLARLHAAGWSVGETGRAGSWLVCGHSGENQLVARGEDPGGGVVAGP